MVPRKSLYCTAWAGFKCVLFGQAKKSDALRALIMDHYGGLYMDLDVECFKPADESLRGYQVVLQGAGDEGINNCVMASVPGGIPIPD